MSHLRRVLAVLAVLLPVFSAQAGNWYVSESTGSNRNEGTKESPFRNIQRAINAAEDGDDIYVAEGNYFGLLDSGNIKINKGVSIIG